MHYKKQGGYTLITSLMFFLAASTAVLAALSDSVIREVHVMRNEFASRQSYFTSESAIEDTLYRIKNSKYVPPSMSLLVGSSTATTTVTTATDGIKSVTATADRDMTQRNITATVNTGVGVDFMYAIQAAGGGINLDTSSVSGDIYTTGSIRALGSSSVSGAAIAAGKSSSNLDVENSVPIPAMNGITFGNADFTQDVAQSFTVSKSLSITNLQIFMKKVLTPANATVRIVADDGGKPGITPLASGVVTPDYLSVSNSWIDIPLSANPVLSLGRTYWITIDANTNPTGYFSVARNDSTFSGGNPMIGRFAESLWNTTSPASLDAYFKISIGSNESGITGQDQFNPFSIGSAYAYTVSFVSAEGSLYCQIGVLNNKACDMSRADPEQLPYPISDSTVTAWKQAAQIETHVGDYVIGGQGDSIGPLRITGNLIVSEGTLSVTGTVWVDGSIIVSDGAHIVSADSAKSYVVGASGIISVSDGATIGGSTGSHIMLVSTSESDPAIHVDGSSHDGAFFAPGGGISITGGATVKVVVGNHVTVSGGSQVIYDPDMAQLNFASGAASLGIKSWKEVL